LSNALTPGIPKGGEPTYFCSKTLWVAKEILSALWRLRYFRKTFAHLQDTPAVLLSHEQQAHHGVRSRVISASSLLLVVAQTMSICYKQRWGQTAQTSRRSGWKVGNTVTLRPLGCVLALTHVVGYDLLGNPCAHGSDIALVTGTFAWMGLAKDLRLEMA
jgi:hypothetical protein